MQRTRWAVLAAFIVVTSANQMLWLTFAPITTDAARHYGVSEGAIGALSGVFPLLYVVLAIPSGFALDRWFRGSVAIGAWLSAAGALLRLVGDSYAWVLLGQLVIAIAQPLVTNSVAKLAGAYTTDEDRPLGIALCSAGLFAGFLMAFGTGAGYGGGGGLRMLLAVQAAYTVIGAVVLTKGLQTPGRVVQEAAATGFAVPIFAGVVLGVRIAPSGQRAKVAVPAASEAVALPADRRADHRQASVGPCVLDSGRGRQRRR